MHSKFYHTYIPYTDLFKVRNKNERGAEKYLQGQLRPKLLLIKPEQLQHSRTPLQTTATYQANIYLYKDVYTFTYGFNILSYKTEEKCMVSTSLNGISSYFSLSTWKRERHRLLLLANGLMSGDLHAVGWVVIINSFKFLIGYLLCKTGPILTNHIVTQD